MKADTAWFPFHVADYYRDTDHLTTEQHGAYLLLIMTCWKRGGRLPSDPVQLAAITHLSVAAWKKHAPVLLAFFRPDGPDFTHKRVLDELERARQIAEKRRQNGLLGGRPPKQTETGEKPSGLATGTRKGKHQETVLARQLQGTPSGDKSPSGRGSRLADDWAPSDIDRAFASKEGFSPDEIERQIQKFRDYWHSRTGNGATKLDWQKTWRNWIRTEADRRPRQVQRRGEVDWC